jgi:hypothetical protein
VEICVSRFSILILGVLPLLFACGSQGAPHSAVDANGAVESLPRHLTVELHADGSLELDGEASSLDRLQEELAGAWSGGQFVAALLWADVGTPRALTQRVLDTFLSVGIEQWRFAWRTPAATAPLGKGAATPREVGSPAPSSPATSATVAASNEPDTNAPPTPKTAEPTRGESTTSVVYKVNLKTIGLHVGGGPNDDATRKPLLALLELSFPDLQRCAEQLSPLPTQLTSFGIDLYIGAQGGHAEARQIRTRLGPEAFRVCVKQALTALRFPAPPQPRVISYSVGFSPISPP